jgi:hypothetical protein
VLTVFYTLLSVSLLVPVLAGLYLERVGTPEALAAIGCGVGCVLVVHLASAGRGFGGLSPALFGLLAAALGCALVAVWRRPGRSATAG